MEFHTSYPYLAYQPVEIPLSNPSSLGEVNRLVKVILDPSHQASVSIHQLKLVDHHYQTMTTSLGFVWKKFLAIFFIRHQQEVSEANVLRQLVKVSLSDQKQLLQPIVEYFASPNSLLFPFVTDYFNQANFYRSVLEFIDTLALNTSQKDLEVSLKTFIQESSISVFKQEAQSLFSNFFASYSYPTATPLHSSLKKLLKGKINELNKKTIQELKQAFYDLNQEQIQTLSQSIFEQSYKHIKSGTTQKKVVRFAEEAEIKFYSIYETSKQEKSIYSIPLIKTKDNRKDTLKLFEQSTTTTIPIHSKITEQQLSQVFTKLLEQSFNEHYRGQDITKREQKALMRVSSIVSGCFLDAINELKQGSSSVSDILNYIEIKIKVFQNSQDSDIQKENRFFNHWLERQDLKTIIEAIFKRKNFQQAIFEFISV